MRIRSRSTTVGVTTRLVPKPRNDVVEPPPTPMIVGTANSPPARILAPVPLSTVSLGSASVLIVPLDCSHRMKISISPFSKIPLSVVPVPPPRLAPMLSPLLLNRILQSTPAFRSSERLISATTTRSEILYSPGTTSSLITISRKFCPWLLLP